MSKRTAAAILAIFPVLTVLLPAVAATEDANGDFLSQRRDIIALYGACSRPELLRLYRESARGYRDYGGRSFLYRRGVFAELAGLHSEQDKTLLEILDTFNEPPDFLRYLIETLRAHGTLGANINMLAADVLELSGSQKRDTLRLLAHAYAWQNPPPPVEALVRSEITDDTELRDFIYFARILAGWGYIRKAADVLEARGLATGADLAARLRVVEALSGISATLAAHRVAEAAIASHLPGPERGPLPPREVFAIRQSRLSRLCDVAEAGAAWDGLLAKTASRPPGEDRWRLLDYAAVLDAAAMPVEEAEAIGAFRKTTKSPQADAFYAEALRRAGDAFTARNLLLGAITGSVDVGEDAYLDLVDALLVLRDAQTFEGIAAICAHLFSAPRQVRTMSQFLRVLGDYPTSDRLFESFVNGSDVGAGTRFDWKGSMLLAGYLLDTGRLDQGRAAAEDAFGQIVAQPKMRRSKRYPAPKQFVDLFARFGGVGDLLDESRRLRKRYPKSVLLKRMEQAALEYLGRADEAVALEREIQSAVHPDSVSLFCALANGRVGRYEEAARLYEEAIAAGAKMPSGVFRELVETYGRLGRWGDAEALFSKRAGKGNVTVWLMAGAFFDRYAQLSRARRAYARLDDLTIRVKPDDLAEAVAFWVKTGEFNAASGTLARRIGIQTSFDAKAAYLYVCVPRSAAFSHGYLKLAGMLEKGPLATDTQLLAFFYRTLGSRFEITLDPQNALAAYRRAMAIEPDNPGNALRLCRVAGSLSPPEGLAAAEALVRRVPTPSARLALVDARLAAGDTNAAADALVSVLEMPLRVPEASKIVDIIENHRLPAGAREKAAVAANAWWPWTLRARLVDATLAAGSREASLGEVAAIVAGGSYVGRALWAAGEYQRAGLEEKAVKVLRLYRARAPEYPAAMLLEADLELARDDAETARWIVIDARRAFPVEPFASLFEREQAHLPPKAVP